MTGETLYVPSQTPECKQIPGCGNKVDGPQDHPGLVYTNHRPELPLVLIGMPRESGALNLPVDTSIVQPNQTIQ